ncbi:hypothetical protein LSH36_667g01067 [Paralvinella palmiformis]|uniref:Annexin n=1 Tax=Paralvinella palmiformis TaxID=53620 RepID=A0AAD9J2Y8_9ANNE|nr:hypothetical protein LSH36_667g01067 [Paralvinella palmiformis]
MYYPRNRPIQRNPRFNPEQAVRELKHAMEIKGCNEEVVIRILTDHNNAQRQEIKNKYRSIFGKELDKDLKKELKGKLESVVVALLTPPREYLVHELRNAMKGLGTDEQTLIDIMMPRTNREVKILKDTYKQVYGRDLDKDIHSETSGQFREVMLAQAQGNRDTTEDVMVAIRDAEELTLAAREKKWDSDSVLYRIMFQRSHAQLRAIFKLYENATGQDIEDSIKQKTKGDLENSLIGLARSAKGIRYFYATRLYEAMKGKGINDDVVIRTFVSRSEIDLARVAEEYQRLFHNSLSSAVAADTKGSYQTILLRLLA